MFRCNDTYLEWWGTILNFFKFCQTIEFKITKIHNLKAKSMSFLLKTTFAKKYSQQFPQNYNNKYIPKMKGSWIFASINKKGRPLIYSQK